MSFTLQKANLWKRISAYLFDFILTVILAVGFGALTSIVCNYDKYNNELEGYYTEYESKFSPAIEQEYGVSFDITQETYDGYTSEQQTNYQNALAALQRKINEELGKNPQAVKLYSTVTSLQFVIIGVGLLLATAVIHFVVPLFFHNGQTLGKKIFDVAVMRTNGVRVSVPVLFVRAIVGLYAIETMFPVFVLLLTLRRGFSIGVILLPAFFILQIAVMIASKTNSSIHDLLTDTVTVTMSSQQIFDSQEALTEAQKRWAAEKAAEAEATQPVYLTTTAPAQEETPQTQVPTNENQEID